MVRIARLIALVVLTGLGLALPATAGVFTDPAAFKADFAAKTVFIEVRETDNAPVLASGTGVLLQSGFVLTSLHVLQEAGDQATTILAGDLSTLVITGIVGANEGQRYKLSVIDQNAARDLLLLRFNPNVSQNFTYACVAKTPAKSGDPIGILGFPLGLSLSVLTGAVSGEEATFITSDIAITFGNSGSGVFNDKGELVGIAKGGITFGGVSTPLARLVPISFAKNLIDNVPDNGNCMSGNQAAIDIDVNYARLSGGLEVPLFIQAQTAGGVSISDDGRTALLGLTGDAAHYDQVPGYHDVALRESLDVPPSTISATIARFWATTEYRDAKPLATELWRKLASNGWMGPRLIADADHSAQDLYCALSITSPHLLAAIGDPALAPDQIPDDTLNEVWSDRPPDYVYDKIDQAARCRPSLSQKVGFLFLLLKNNSTVALSNVKVSSVQFAKGKFDPQIWRLAEAEGIEQFADVAASPALVDYADQLAAGQSKTRAAPNLGPGESFIWLDSVYRTDDDAFEDHYLDTLEVPTALKFTANGRDQTMPIRLPLRGAALPEAMPFGWFHQ